MHAHSHPLSLSLSLTHTFTEAQYGVEVMVIAVDFSSGQEIYPRLAQQLKNLDIGVLGVWSIRDGGEGKLYTVLLPLISGL